MQQHLARLKRVRTNRKDRRVAAVEYPQLRAQPCQQFVQAEWLGNVVIGAEVKAANDISLAISAGQHDDRHLVPLPPEPGTEIASVAVWHADVEQYRVQALFWIVDDLVGLNERPRDDDGKPMLTGEIVHQHLADRSVIFDEQNTSLGRHF